MLLVSRQRGHAYSIPVLLSFVSILCAASTTIHLFESPGWAAAGAALLVLGLLALTVSEFRVMRVRRDALTVTTPLGTSRLELAEVSLGIRVRYGSRGGTTYTVYALSGDREVDLSSTGSLKRAERHRETLRETLLAGRLSEERARRSHAEVARREAAFRQAAEAAQRQLDAYYAKRSPKIIFVVIALVALVFSIAMAVFFETIN